LQTVKKHGTGGWRDDRHLVWPLWLTVTSARSAS